MPKKKSPPKYRLHKARDCAVVTINGKNRYLGPYGSDESHERYARLIAEHFHNGNAQAVTAGDSNGDDTGITVVELVARYWSEYVEKRHVKDGRPTDRQAHILVALRPLCKLYKHLPVREFSPKKLKLVRDEMIRVASEGGRKPNRRYINDHVGIIKRMFRWAVAEELVEASVHHALAAVENIGKGHDDRVSEGRPVRPVPAKDIDAVLPHLSPQIATMVQVQKLTGMRPDEVTIMRPCDIDRHGDVWWYYPDQHKTQHLGRARAVPLGPKAQALIVPWLDRPCEAFLFDPRAVVAARRKRNGSKRKAPRASTNGRSRPVRDHYDDCTYRRAVKRACVRAGVPDWTPGRLRHNAATAIKQKYDIEAARTTLGHATASTTEIYAERDLSLAERIAREIG